MAIKLFRGDAAATSQVITLSIGGTIAANDSFTVTLNGKTVTGVATDTTTPTTAANLAAAWTDLSSTIYPEFAEIDAVASGSTVVLTAATPGKPFGPITLSEVSTSGTFTQTATSAGSSPNDWSLAVNWSPSGVPASGDTVFISNNDVDILYGLSQSSVALTELNIDSTYTGTIGLPITNTDAAPYTEYRTEYLNIGAGTINIGAGSGSGSGRLKINTPTTTTQTINVYTTGSPDDPTGALQLLAYSNSNTLNIYGGNIGIACNPTEGGGDYQVNTINVIPSSGSTATLQMGEADCVNLNVNGGTVTTVFGAITGLSMSAGTVTLGGATPAIAVRGGTLQTTGNVTTLSLDGGTVTFVGSGTIGTANIGAQATLLFNTDLATRTVTNCNLYAGGTLNDSNRTVTWTNPIVLARCAIGDVKLNLGDNIKLAPTYF